jgi:hypothetical protein
VSCVRVARNGSFIYELSADGDARTDDYTNLTVILPSLDVGSYACNPGPNQVELSLTRNTTPKKSYLDQSHCYVSIMSTCSTGGHVHGTVTNGVVVNLNDGTQLAVSETFHVPCSSPSFGTCP